jgi:hypothetical protein
LFTQTLIGVRVRAAVSGESAKFIKELGKLVVAQTVLVEIDVVNRADVIFLALVMSTSGKQGHHGGRKRWIKKLCLPQGQRGWICSHMVVWDVGR